MIRLAVRCRPEQAEAVLAELLQLAPNGVEEERLPQGVEYAIYGGPGEVPDLGELRAALGDSEVDVITTAVPDDWADRWTDFHRPIVIADRIRVRPSWWKREGEAIDVVIDPAQAFGTGAHATTRLCLELLIEFADANGAEGELADWGTGSGVLAIAGAKLGWDPVIACDRERAALDAAGANAQANGVPLELQRVDVREQLPPAAPTVTANLTAPLLGECAGHLSSASGLPQALICSGMLEREANEVAGAFAAAGLHERARRADGDWSALLLERGKD
jgi:ribosomal protein L11 methyltransferase